MSDSDLKDLHSFIANDKTNELARIIINTRDKSDNRKSTSCHREEVLTAIEDVILSNIQNQRCIWEEKDKMIVRKGDLKCRGASTVKEV